MEKINILLLLDWLNNHQVVAASLINVFVVLTTAVFTNQWQFHRDNQRWQREKLYQLYTDTQDAFTELIKSCGTSKSNYPELFYMVLQSLSKLSLVCSNLDATEINDIRTKLKALFNPMNSGWSRVKIEDLEPLNEQFNTLIQKDLRLKELFK